MNQPAPTPNAVAAAVECSPSPGAECCAECTRIGGGDCGMAETLPEALRSGIAAMVKAAKGGA